MSKILCIDGMGAPAIVWNTLVKPMVDKYGASADYSEWQDWAQFLKHDYDVVVGHSLGGDSAVRFCNWLKQNGRPQPKLLMTLGARHQSDVSLLSWIDLLWPADSGQAFDAPNSVAHNFWTWGPLPSAPMNGAVENVNVSSLFIWHGNIPSASAVQSCLDNFLKSAG